MKKNDFYYFLRKGVLSLLKESKIKFCLFITGFLLITTFSYSQIGPVIWEDNFNTFNTAQWTKDIGDGCNIGLCGWGNQELQSYEANNVYIGDVPGEAGNKALVLEAKNQVFPM